MKNVLAISAISLVFTGCWTNSASLAPTTESIPVNSFQIASQDVSMSDAKCVVKMGQQAIGIAVRGKTGDFPLSFKTGLARIVVNRTGGAHVMQSCIVKVTREGDTLAIDGEMRMPKRPCSGSFQIIDGNNVILERAISIEEK